MHDRRRTHVADAVEFVVEFIVGIQLEFVHVIVVVGLVVLQRVVVQRVVIEFVEFFRGRLVEQFVVGRRGRWLLQQFLGWRRRRFVQQFVGFAPGSTPELTCAHDGPPARAVMLAVPAHTL